MRREPVQTKDTLPVHVLIEVINIFYHFGNGHALVSLFTWQGPATSGFGGIVNLAFDIKWRNPRPIAH